MLENPRTDKDSRVLVGQQLYHCLKKRPPQTGIEALYTRDNNTPRNFGPLATHQLAGGVGATTYNNITMDKDLLGEESAGKPPSRTLVSCLGRHRPYAANVNPIKRVRLKTRSIAEEVTGLAFFFSHFTVCRFGFF